MSSLRSSIDFRRRIGLFIVRPTLTAREQNAHHVETFQIWFLSRYLSEHWRPRSALLSVQKIFYTSLVVQTLIEVILSTFAHLFSVSLSIIMLFTFKFIRVTIEFCRKIAHKKSQSECSSLHIYRKLPGLPCG